MKQCVIVGAGTYGQVYAQYLKDSYDVVGFIDDDSALENTTVGGISVLGNVDYLFNKMSKDVAVFVPIGNNDVRLTILKSLLDAGFSIPSFIHASVEIHPSVTYGKGVYILPSSNIMPYTTIKDFVMISMGVNIAHHVTIEDGCFFSQGVNVGASISIAERAYLGIASTVMTGVERVGRSSLVGAGAMVTRNVEDNAVVVGNPAKVLRYK